MLSHIRKRLSYANVVATIALVFAMSGGALAAGHYLITSTGQISPRVLKSLKDKIAIAGAIGRAGAGGPPGPQGMQGPKGDSGAVGKDGVAGPEGPAGKEGPPGKIGKPGPEGEEGLEGKEGKEGSPWVAGGTLPSGETEEGQWAVQDNVAEIEEVLEQHVYAISFSLPLAIPPKPHFIKEGQGEGQGEKNELPEENGKKVCKGSISKPEAEPGNLCIFTLVEQNVITPPLFLDAGSFGINMGGKTGDLMLFSAERIGSQSALGTWAVTAG